MQIKLRVDSRSKRWNVAKTFGQVATVDLPESFSIKEVIPDVVQPAGDISCLAISCCDVANDKDGVQYDYKDLFARIPHSQFGAVPQDCFGESLKNGLLPQGQSTRTKVFSSYYEAHTSNKDAFDSVRSSLMTCGYPIIVYTNWYDNWQNVNIYPVGKNVISAHAYDVSGWKQVNGEPMLIVDAWLGYEVYMSREVFNKAVGALGCGTAVFSTLEMDINRKKTIMETIIDAMQNVILLMKQLLLKKNETMTPYQPINELVIPEVTTQKYWWDNVQNCRHSVRTICDEMDLSVQEKNELCATVGAESNWNPKAIGKPNFDGTRDYGIVQVNEKYWIGPGKLFPSTDYVLNNPEACIRWMCKEWKAGHKNWWYGFKNGSYKKFL